MKNDLLRNTPAYAGKTSTPTTSNARTGNTPAYAGKTKHRASCSRTGWKHPRLRGEDFADGMSLARPSETPPLTRGRPQLEPRPSSLPETPPLTRGRLNCLRERGLRNGNTPAYAGKTKDGIQALADGRKHPRLRGEDKSKVLKVVFILETPPLTRGRHARRNPEGYRLGNTPAYAGKTATFCTKTNLTIQNTLLLTDLSVFH